MDFSEALSKTTETQKFRKYLKNDSNAEYITLYKNKTGCFVVEYKVTKIIRGQQAIYKRYSANELLNTSGWEQL